MSPLFFRELRRAYVIIAAILAALFLATAVVSPYIHPPRQIVLFDSGVPGRNAQGIDEAREALDYAKRSHFDAVLNYSSINASPADIKGYLQYADKIGMKVILSLKDFLGKEDADPVNLKLHQAFGPTTEDQVNNLVPWLNHFPAVQCYYTADEPEGSPQEILDQLSHRHQQIHQLAGKDGPAGKCTLASYYRMPDMRHYLQALKPGSDDQMVDYYPYPYAVGQTYGTIDEIKDLAADVSYVAGDHSWMAIQAFSYYVSEPTMIERFGFPPQPPDANKGAPDTATMVHMGKLALQGGVRNLAFFSYGYAKQVGPGQLDMMARAVDQLHDSFEFTTLIG